MTSARGSMRASTETSRTKAPSPARISINPRLCRDRSASRTEVRLTRKLSARSRAGDGDRGSHPEFPEPEATLGGACFPDDVVEAHDHIGHDDDPDGLEQGGAGLRAAVARLIALAHQLDGDPDQQEAAYHLEERNAEQVADDRDEQEPEPDRPQRPPDPAQELLALGQRSHGERDDQRIVPGQCQVDEDDLGDADPERWVEDGDGHGQAPIRSPGAMRRAPTRPGAGATTA